MTTLRGQEGVWQIEIRTTDLDDPRVNLARLRHNGRIVAEANSIRALVELLPDTVTLLPVSADP
jgi:hypothetical protein